MLNRKEREIFADIPKPQSENNPNQPEFPEIAPKFPATPTVKLHYKNFKNISVKDESKNPTGTHKDRMAWELVCQYRHFLDAKQRGLIRRSLPQFSMISSGNAALAVGTAFKKYNLPKLKVLVDINVRPYIVEFLRNNHCEVYFTDLSLKVLNLYDILRLTENPEGFDVTSNDALDRTTIFYDWLSFEIINTDPDYIFCPFGTGELYENICNVQKRESKKAYDFDPRLRISAKRLGSINVIGVTSQNPNTIADKLYAPHLPFAHFNEQWLRFYRDFGFIGQKSIVNQVQERFIKKAYNYLSGQGIDCEPSGAAGLAYLIQNEKFFKKDDNILIVNTGKGLF